MFSLRSARGRAILAGVVLVMLLAGVATLAVWGTRDIQQQHRAFEHTSAAAGALESAHAQFRREQAALLSFLLFSDDSTTLDDYHDAAAAIEQHLSHARAESLAEGEPDEALAIDDLTERIGQFNGQVDSALPFLLAADPETRLQLTTASKSEMSSDGEAIVADLQTLVQKEQQQLATTRAAADRAADTTLWLLIGSSTVAFLVAAGTIAMLIVSVVRPLAALRASARAITSGDLEARAKVSGPEEVASLAHDFNEMTETLAAKTQEYIDTTNLTGDLILKVDERGRWAFLNDAACQFYGRPREELLGTDSRVFLHPDEVELTAQAIRQMRANKKPDSGFVNRQITPMGTRVVEWNGHPLFDASGHYTAIQITGRDITERKQLEEERERLHAEMAERAITDSLTGLYNHAHFYQRLDEEIERSKRYKRRFAVVMMDVDAFKHYNDSRGHQAGDDALRLLADCIRTGIRRSDIAFRYGGDEFATILLNADSARAQAVVNRINRRIAAELKKMDDQAAAWLGLSAGVASFPQDATTPDELVQMADAALYNAKRLAWARGLTQPEQAIESQAYPHKLIHETQTGMLTTAAGSLATVLQDLGVSEVAAALDLRSIAAVGAASEMKDRYIRGHQERASLWAAALAEDMGLSSEQVRNIRIAGLLHDIGKVSINDGILNKPGKLTEEEFNKVKRHAPIGAEIMLSETEALQQLAAIVRYHHEHFDGTGYPDGIAGERIPLEARIMSVVDVFDAMTHERSYRKALSREEAIAELEHGAGTQFDPEVVKAFLALLKRRSEEAAAPVQAASEDRRLASARVAAARKD